MLPGAKTSKKNHLGVALPVAILAAVGLDRLGPFRGTESHSLSLCRFIPEYSGFSGFKCVHFQFFFDNNNEKLDKSNISNLM